MSQLTTRFGLYLPGGGLSGTNLPDEVVDIDKINGNFSAIDKNLGAPLYLSTGRPSAPVDGQLIFESDTKRLSIFSATAANWVQPSAERGSGTIYTVSTLAALQAITTQQQGDFGYVSGLDRVYRNVDGTQTGWRQLSGGLVTVVPTSAAAAAGTATLNPDGSITFTAATTVSANGAFTSAYDNYLITVQIDSNSAAASISFRLRQAGVDYATANGYQYGFNDIQFAGTATTTSSTTDTSGTIGRANAAGTAHIKLDLQSPARAQNKTWEFQASDPTRYRGGAGIVALATAADGITIIPASGTLTGTMRIFGYNNE